MRYTLLVASLLLLNACNAPVAPLRQAALPQTGLRQMAQPRLMLSRAVTTISPAEARQWLADPNASWRVLDVRTAAEAAEGKLRGSELIDFYGPDFKQRLQQLDRNQPYILYCRSGNRSGQALVMMRELGFRNVYEIKGGTLAWAAAGYELVR